MSALEDALAALKAAEGVRDGLKSRLRSCKEMVNDAKAGNGLASLEALEQLQQKLLMSECDALVAVKERQADLARLAGEATGNQEHQPNAAAGHEAKRTLAPTHVASQPKRQMTMAGFVFVKSANGKLRELLGPKIVAENLDLTCSAPGCDSAPFKSRQGWVEHQRWCTFFKSESVSQQNIREILAAKRSAVEASVVRLGPGLLQPNDPIDLSGERSDDEVSKAAGATSHAGNSTAPSSKAKVKGGQRGSDVRVTYHLSLKYRVARLVVAAASDLGKVKGACTFVADKTGIPVANVFRWYKNVDALHREVVARKGKKGRGYRGMVTYNLRKGGQTARDSAAETVVLAKFEKARENGVRVGPSLVKVWMLRTLRELYPSDTRARTFKASSSWLHKFLARHNLVERRATNKKELSVAERLPKVQKWHKRWQRDISAGPQADPVFGKYLPCNIMNSDQVPFSIGDVMTTTYETRGAKAVRISQQPGSDKRFCTIQICLSLDGNVQCQPMLIFKGKGNIPQAEREAYDPRVAVFFQEKAWMDGDLFVQWVNGPLKKHVEELPPGPKVMILDNLRAQTVGASCDALAGIGVDRRLLPAGVTDMIQPVDQNVGYDVKRAMIRILTDKLVESEDFLNRWLGKGDYPTYPAKDRRILITHLLGQAWQEFCARKDFLALGLSSGCVMPKLGISRTHPRIGGRQINIKGIDDYGFEHADIELSTEIDPSAADDPDDEADDAFVQTSAASSAPVGQTTPPTIATATAAQARNPASGRRESTQAQVISTCDLFAPESVANTASAASNTWIVPDINVWDPQLDDTDANSTEPAPVAPEGFRFVERPLVLPPVSSWVKRVVYWRSQLPDGELLNWIKAEIVGGPNDPAQAVSGVTMRLKCDKRLDQGTPKCFQGKLACIVQVALTIENYGSKWFLLDKE